MSQPEQQQQQRERTWISLNGLPSMVQVELPFLVAPRTGADNVIPPSNLHDDVQQEDQQQQQLLLEQKERARPYSQVVDGFLGGPANLAAHTVDAVSIPIRLSSRVNYAPMRVALRQQEQSQTQQQQQTGVQHCAVVVEGSCHPSNDILVKISYRRVVTTTLRRRKNKNNRADEETTIVKRQEEEVIKDFRAEPVAILAHRVAFDTPADWVFLNNEDKSANLVLPVQITTRTTARSGKRLESVRGISPQPDAASADRSKPPPNMTVKCDDSSSATMVPVPAAPNAEIQTFLDRQLKTLSAAAIVQRCLTQLMQERPMWAPTALTDALIARCEDCEKKQQKQQQQQGEASSSSSQQAKKRFKNSAIVWMRLATYTFSGGCFSGLRVRFGFDPRQHPESDSIVFAAKVVVSLSRESRSLIADVQRRVPRKVLVQTLAEIADEVPMNALAEHTAFSQNLLTGKRRLHPQLSSLLDAPSVRALLLVDGNAPKAAATAVAAATENPRSKKFSAINGFFTAGAINRLRQYLKRSYVAWLTDTVVPQLGEYVKLQEFDAAAGAADATRQMTTMLGASKHASSAQQQVAKWVEKGREALAAVLAQQQHQDEAAGNSSSSDGDEEDDQSEHENDDDGDDDEEDESLLSRFMRQQQRQQSQQESQQQQQSPKRRSRSQSSSSASPRSKKATTAKKGQASSAATAVTERGDISDFGGFRDVFDLGGDRDGDGGGGGNEDDAEFKL